ncbi:MAG: peptidoglycan editing factor PgeF [Woeseiaceae bacterium]|nr:peptidoglycan editing factor PgeF [Woeseiaceae bacterium]
MRELELVVADWPAPPNVRAGCTTRAGGVSEGVYTALNLGAHVGDESGAVAENRRRFVTAVELPGEPLWLRQVHGVHVSDAAQYDPDEEADAIVSADGSDVLGIMTADCLGILLCADDASETAALHCGWRSLSGGLVARTVERMRTPPERLLAWLGPAIAQPAFEVGSEVREVFMAGIDDAADCFVQNERGRWQADLYGLARRYLDAVGIVSVHGGGLCTFADRERFFSYRRDGQTGRLCTFIYLENEGDTSISG